MILKRESFELSLLVSNHLPLYVYGSSIVMIEGNLAIRVCCCCTDSWYNTVMMGYTIKRTVWKSYRKANRGSTRDIIASPLHNESIWKICISILCFCVEKIFLCWSRHFYPLCTVKYKYRSIVLVCKFNICLCLCAYVSTQVFNSKVSWIGYWLEYYDITTRSSVYII